jgi:hypothetical protein
MGTLRTAALNLLRLAGFQSIHTEMQTVMHDIAALLEMIMRRQTLAKTLNQPWGGMGRKGRQRIEKLHQQCHPVALLGTIRHNQAALVNGGREPDQEREAKAKLTIKQVTKFAKQRARLPNCHRADCSCSPSGRITGPPELHHS